MFLAVLSGMSYIANDTTLGYDGKRIAGDRYRSVPARRNGKGPGKKRASAGRAARNGEADFSLLVHCHLCWDWVWQRPQQFLSRLSRRHPVLFVETIGPDPQLAAPLARFHIPSDSPNITVLRLQFPAWRWADGAYVDRERRRLVQEFLAGPVAGKFERPVQWFYDPMAVIAFAGRMNEVATVYDCMDELSKFKDAPPEIADREKILLSKADVVFTGGRKLYESRRVANPNCHFYGCGVDVAHFGSARLAHTPNPLASLPKPVLGYFGVIDERLDYSLLAKLAEAQPEWSIAMVGPVAKVSASSLPRRPNLHWLGGKDYADLPAYGKGFDVCLMPFALNASTEYINPTKTLEYAAMGKPIVSSAVPDVVTNFSHFVSIARNADGFIQQCRQAVRQPEAAAIQAGLRAAQENTWEVIVEKLESHIRAAIPEPKAAARRNVIYTASPAATLIAS